MNEDSAMLQVVDRGCCHLALVGRVTYANCRGLDTFISRVLADTDITDVVADLRRTSYLDSTVLGLLATIASGLETKNGHRAVLICAEGDVSILLKSLALDSVFDMLEQSDDTVLEDFQPIADASSQARPTVRVLLKAHRALLDLSDENRGRFQSVVSCLEEEART